MDIGTKLQQARMDKGITLAHLSNVTKMSSHVLELIERSEFAQLPGGLLTRGHLRAYASEVGLDSEKIVSEYRSEYESASDADELPVRRTSYQDYEVRVPYAGLMLMIALGVFVYFVLPRPAERPVSMDFAARTAGAAVVDVPTISKAVATAPQNAPLGGPSSLTAEAEGLQIELRPQAECWVSAIADGRVVLYRLLQAGEQVTIDAHEDVELRVGDAGALTYFVNGDPGRKLGASAEAVTVRITNDNSATWRMKESPRVVGI